MVELMYWTLRRNQLWLTRLFFLTVIGMGLIGLAYARSRWTLTPEDLNLDFSLLQGDDWVDLAASILEGMVQLFQAITAPI